jgi:biopolymer transport protein ExbB
MKNLTNIVIILACTVVAFAVYYLILGADGNFVNGDRHNPANMLGTIYTGGFLVGALISCILLAVTYTAERLFSIGKAGGAAQMLSFGKNVVELVRKGSYDAALKACDEQRGSLANVLRAAVDRYRVVEKDAALNADQKLAEVQRTIEKNLVILSTVASISTMIGLLGTTMGMIKSFQALGAGGTVSAQMLSIGISEALYNTAGGLFAAILSIVAYNFFTTKVDNFVYQMDETILDLMETLSIKTGAGH